MVQSGNMATTRWQWKPWRCLVALTLLWTVLDCIYADISAASVTPGSLTAGSVTDVTVAFTTSTDIVVGSSIVVSFPSGFEVSTSGSTLNVDASYGTTLSVSSITSNEIRGLVDTVDIVAGTAFAYLVTTVTNPAATPDITAFTLAVLDTNGDTTDTTTDFPAVTISSSAFSAATVAPDSKDAGVTGTATISLTSDVALPVGSIVAVVFPSEFTVATTSLTVISNLDVSSSVAVVSGEPIVLVTVKGSGVAAGTSLSFAVDGITNPGAIALTGIFSVYSADGGGKRYQVGNGIAGVEIKSTTLDVSAHSLDTYKAGVSSVLEISFTTAIALSAGYHLVIQFPADFVVPSVLQLDDTASAVTGTPTVTNQVVVFEFTGPYGAGFHTVQLKTLRNPGVTTTGFFTVSTADPAGLNIEISPSLSGVTTTAGVITDATFVPDQPHPGISSRVRLVFTTAAAVDQDTLIYVALPANDYAISVPDPEVVVVSPIGTTASVAFDQPHTALLVLFTSTRVIPEDSTVELMITALSMPPSVRSSLAIANIQTWNSAGLRLDGPSTITLAEITALTDLTAGWSTTTPRPGITSNVILTFDTSGRLPAGGMISIHVPESDFSAMTNPSPVVSFINPYSIPTTTSWDPTAKVLTLSLTSGTGIPAQTTDVQLVIQSLNTPPSVRAARRLVATISTLHPDGTLIDGPSPLDLDDISAGPVLGSRMWEPASPFAGVVSSQVISFFSSGKLDEASQIELGLPDTGWSMAPTGVATLTTHPLGQVTTWIWDAATRTINVVLNAGTTIPAYSLIELELLDILNPPKETGVTHASIVTKASDGELIDGPGTLSILAISRGTFKGEKVFRSVNTSSASMKCDQVLKLTLSGGLPSGSLIQLTFPPNGWRLTAPSAPVARFVLPATGVSVDSVTWTDALNELAITTNGDLASDTPIEILIKDMINPFEEGQGGSMGVLTTLSDSGVVDESIDIAINPITSETLDTFGTWNAGIETPGMPSTHTVQLMTGGGLEVGATICLIFPIVDGWDALNSVSATIAANGGAPTDLDTVSWDALTSQLCIKTMEAIPQESLLLLTFKNIRSPPSERSETTGSIVIRSHLGGNVNSGLVQLPQITRGTLGGALKWQSELFSPGPVAGLETTAALSFTTMGRILGGGKIWLTLPMEWAVDVACTAVFFEPAVTGAATCDKNQVTVNLFDTIDELTDVQVIISHIFNPPTVLPEGIGFGQTLAPDGGVIDESGTITTGSIDSALLGVANAGDERVAVVGVKKKFTFQGFSVGEGDIVKFMDASTTSDANCGTATTGVSDVGGIDVVTVGEDHGVDLKFVQASPDGSPFVICYKFGSNPFKLYSSLTFTVKEIVTMSVSVGSADTAVAGYPKFWKFAGQGLVLGDLVRWIDMDVVKDGITSGTTPDCTNPDSLAALSPPAGATLEANEDEHTRAINAHQQVHLEFSSANAGKTFALCYKFGAEPYKIYTTMTIQVNHVHRITATQWGRDDVAVADAQKTFTLLSDGLLANDRLYFIESGSAPSCEVSANDLTRQLVHTINGQAQSVLFVSANGEIDLSFAAQAAGKAVTLCFQFGIEPFQLYEGIQLEVKMVTTFTGTKGSPRLAVADVPEPLTFRGFGLDEADQVRWIHSGQEDCEDNLATLVEPVSLDAIDTIALDVNLSASFNFSSTQADFHPVLCYRFGIEKFKAYPNLDIKIGTITAKSTLMGSKEVAVVASRKIFTLYGTNLAANDRVSWTIDPFTGCTKTTLLIRDPKSADADFVSFTTLRQEFGVAFAALNSGERAYLCYGFGTEPLRLYRDLYVDVKSVLNMRTLLGANDVAVAGAIKTFLFEGDGVTTGDYAKFVPSTSQSCADPGVPLLNLKKAFDDLTEMAVYVYENIAGLTVGGFQFSPATSPAAAGLNRVLCYRFGSEPFFFYENFHIDVKTIWRLQQFDTKRTGQASIAVVDDLKLVSINGVGVSAKDQVKWVDPSAQSDQDCADMPSKGLISRTINVFANLTMWYPFDYGSGGNAWLLCYKFDAEPYRLYSSITVQVKQISDLLDAAYLNISALGKVATIGQRKAWRPIGSGIQTGDMAKFVSLSVTSSVDCGLDELNTAGGSSLMTVVSAPDIRFTGTFTTFPASLTDVYHLCYKFQDEPYTYVKRVEVSTYGIMSMDRKVFLANAATPVQLNGFRLSNIDRLGWSQDKTSCTNVLGVVNLVEGTTTVLFDHAYDPLFLCYSFDRQPFTIFDQLRVTVVTAEVWVPKTVTIVAELAVEVALSGTFGLTVSSDQVAWIPSDAVSCSDEVRSKYSAVMSTAVVSTAPSVSNIPRAGSGIISVTFVPPSSSALASENLASWKLCYRFGSMANFLMFGDVLCDVLNIARIELIESTPTSAGSDLQFQFYGTGIQDFDVAKWVASADATGDADCDRLEAVGGSKASNVIGQTASFSFTQETSTLKLCYQFTGHANKLFSSVPVKDVTKSRQTTSVSSTTSSGVATDSDSTSSAVFVPNRDVATVRLKLDKDISDIPSGSPAETTFKTGFTAALASSLGIDTARIQILEILAGSVIVRFQLLPSDNVADPLVHELLQDLATQLQNPTSPLLQSAVIRISDPIAALSSEITTLPSPSPEPVVISARGYKRNGLFTFARNVYSVTEKTGTLAIRVLRLQGTGSTVTLPFKVDTVGRTATYGADYRFIEPIDADLAALFLKFDIGVREKSIVIEIINDNVKEAHFEQFQLVLGDPGAADTAFGDNPTTIVRIYDYDAGTVLASSIFPANQAGAGATQGNTLGWGVTENGRNVLRVDANGIFAVDEVIGDAEYNQKCDVAAPTGTCTYSCEVGGDLDSITEIRDARRVLRLDGMSYVVTSAAMSTFPTTVLTVSFWIKTTQKNRDACVLSYVAPGETFAGISLAICDPTNLHLVLTSLNDHRESGLATFIDVTDGAWHFIAFVWSGDDGRVHVYDNGMLAFDGGPYRVAASLSSGGFFVLGQLVSSLLDPAPCYSSVQVTDPIDPSVTTVPQASCRCLDGRGLQADIQHVHLWSRELSRSELRRELEWPLKLITNGLLLGWNFDAINLNADLIGMTVNDLSTRRQEQKNTGLVQCTSSSCLVSGVLPSVTPGFPCGRVYANLWHFVAPSIFLAALPSAYGGRLQFRMLAPSFNGTPRPRRGQISLFGSDNTHVTLALGGFPLPKGTIWTHYSVILREDFGWIHEPSGVAATMDDFKAVLANPKALWLRGDLWGMDASGQGQEVVYVNDIKLFAR